MKKKLEIFCTIGPSSLKKEFLKFSKKNISLLRLNMSHIEIKDLVRTINIIRKFTPTPICIDTEGAQIRTKIEHKKKYKKNQVVILKKKNNNKLFYPDHINRQLKKNDILDIGFSGLKIKIQKNSKKILKFLVLENGLFENNKGVHLINRKIQLNFLTNKDLEAIEIAKKLKIKNFALSFTNSIKDIKNFEEILPTQKKIYKIETKKALKDFKKLVKIGDNFLIDRGDLSKEISIEMIPIAQKKILRLASIFNKNVYVATNFLESMIIHSSPTRGEVNDIYSTLSQGSKGLVLAAETAIGKHPISCVKILHKMFNTFKKNKNILT